jgi:hypothetical protein
MTLFNSTQSDPLLLKYYANFAEYMTSKQGYTLLGVSHNEGCEVD